MCGLVWFSFLQSISAFSKRTRVSIVGTFQVTDSKLESGYEDSCSLVSPVIRRGYSGLISFLNKCIHRKRGGWLRDAESFICLHVINFDLLAGLNTKNNCQNKLTPWPSCRSDHVSDGGEEATIHSRRHTTRLCIHPYHCTRSERLHAIVLLQEGYGGTMAFNAMGGGVGASGRDISFRSMFCKIKLKSNDVQK